MANRTYPREDNEYPEVMSKIDPLIIRVNPLVLVVGSTTYTAKVKIGYKFNGFLVHVSGVGIPIYKEEVDITGYNTGETTTAEGSDAYNYVKDKARDWMDTLEQSMLNDNKEKNIVDLLREIKYQMHFDLSGHQPSSTIEGSPDYDPRIEVCDDVPTYITDIYQLLADMNAKLNNLMLVIASDGTGDSATHKNELITSVTIKYGEEENPHGFTVENSYSGEPVIGLNKRIEDLNASIGTASDDDNAKTVIGRLNVVANKLAKDDDNIADKVYSAVTNLVAKMDDMNGRIGVKTDDYNTQTLFGQLKLANTHIGLTTQSDSETLINYMRTINTNTNTIVNYPLLTTFNATDALWLTYWVHDVYGGDVGHTSDPSGIDNSGFDHMIAKMKMFFTQFNTCTATKLDAAMVNAHILYQYNTSSGDRGFERSSNGAEWGIKIHDRGM